MNTKLSIIVLLAAVLTTVCSAATLIQTFNGTLPPPGWDTYIGTGSGATSVSWLDRGNAGGYLSAALARSDADDGKAYVKASMGSDIIPTYAENPTPWNEMPEIWMSVDIKWLNGMNSTDPSGMFGIFNDDGDNDRSPGFNFMGVCFFKGHSVASPLQVYLRAFRGNGLYSASKTVTGAVLTTTGAVGDTYRISMHFYQGATDYFGDITVANLTHPSEPVLSQTGLLILGGTWYFERGLDSFGVHNALSSLKVSNTYVVDNMYFSTESAPTGLSSPSWIPLPPPSLGPNSIKIIAQPESREIYYDPCTSSYSQYATACSDANYSFIGYNHSSGGYNDGSLVLAFKLPTLPPGQVITNAAFNWFYVSRYKLFRSKHDLYVLKGRPASANPVIVSEEDYYMGNCDYSNAMLLKHNVTDAWDVNTNQTINEWRSTDLNSDSLALFLQNQCYNSGAQADDWVFIRFSQRWNTLPYLEELMRGPGYSDPNYRPYIEYTLGPAKERLVAQPETREVFYEGEIMETSDVNSGGIPDPNITRMTFTDSGLADPLYDGALVLAFRLPELPANKVISKASLKWYYYGYYKVRPEIIDLYGITPARDASSDPVVLAGDNYVDEPSVGDKDTMDAMMIEQNITPVSALDDPNSSTGYINRWVSSDISSHLLAWFLHEQYLTGGDANDYVLLRFNGVLLSSAYTHHDIISPRYHDPNYRPYIEYELVDVNEGNWRPVALETPATIIDTGVLTDPPGSIGCFDIGGAVYKNAELMLPFEFPQLQSGEYVKDVELSGIWDGKSRLAAFDADLYGLPHRSSTAFQSSDYWVGPYAPQTGDVPNMNSGTPLDSDVFDGFAIDAGQKWLLGSEGSLRAACYMNNLKTAGATPSDYGFLRFGERFDFYNYQRNSISDFAMWVKVATEAPSCPGAPDTESACPGYDNPDRLLADVNGDCKVAFQDMAVMAEHWMQCAAVPASNCP